MRILELVLLLSVVIFFQCEEPSFSERDYPRILTLEVTDKTESGATFNGDFRVRGDFNIISYGFVWNTFSNPQLTDSDYIEESGNITSKFSITVNNLLQKGATYSVRAFVKTDDFIVYGKNVTFVSQGSNGPEITGVSPGMVHYLDTISIYGNLFSNVSQNNEVRLGGVTANKVFSSDSLIKVILPATIPDSVFNVSVTSSGSTTTYSEKILFIPPIIFGTSKNEVVFGDTLDVFGEYFSENPDIMEVFVGDASARIIELEKTRIRIIVPATNESLLLTVFNNFNQKYSYDGLIFLPPVINSINPNIIKYNGVLLIEGMNFGYDSEALFVTIDDKEVDVVQLKNNSFKVLFKKTLYSTRFPIVKIEVGNHITSIPIEIGEPWIKISEIPPQVGRFGSIAFSIGNYGYVLLGFNAGKSMWRFDPATNSWDEMAEFPGEPRRVASEFVIGDFAYVGGGVTDAGNEVNDFYRYNSISNTWSAIQSFPYLVSNAEGLALNGIGYLATRRSDNNFFQYDPGLDEWSPLSDLNFSNNFAIVDVGFTSSNRLFIYGSGNTTSTHELQQYNPATGSWFQRPDAILNNIEGAVSSAASTGNFGFIFTRNSYLNRYNIGNNTWEVYTNFASGRRNTLAFEINNKIYVGGGRSTTDNFDLWEYDPSYEVD